LNPDIVRFDVLRLWVLLGCGSLSCCSFGFDVRKSDWYVNYIQCHQT
jgi:hypothetical protein